jgi:phage tail-like protein
MADRTIPYGAYNFIVEMPTGRDATEPLGGFSEVSGLSSEITISEYRNGNELVNYPRKLPQTRKTGDVTLKRGLIDATDFWDWMTLVNTTGPAAKRNVRITLRDETGSPKQRWTLRGVVPMKYTAPTLNAKGGQDVAIEELVLSSEAIEFEAVT